MRLERVRVGNYRCIEDSGWVEIRDNVLCLVGKNESGKTSFLTALEKLSPVDSSRGSFNIEKDFPRKGLMAYKKRHATAPAKVVEAVFRLDDADKADLQEIFGSGVILADEVTVTKGYNNQSAVATNLDEAAAIQHALDKAPVPTEEREKLLAATTLAEVQALAEGKKDLAPVVEYMKKAFPEGVAQRVEDEIWGRVPDFLYFDDYSVMKGRVSLPTMKELHAALKAEKTASVKRADRTFLALLELVGTTPAELIASQSNTEAITANLESAAIEITREVFNFWSQGNSLRVNFQILAEDSEDGRDGRSGPVFHTRIWNDRHQMTVSFDERSKGFVWFFSFLAYFSQVKEHPRQVILLLDEPGLSLHAKAQADFLRFIDERLASDHQVFYTTHSPFMVDPNEPNRIVLVEDKDDMGTVLSSDFIRSRPGADTVYPLMAAMGIDMTQSLFIGPNTLLVEGPSELLYLPAISKILAMRDRTTLDPRWTITPMNGADKAPAFVALFGANRLNMAIVLDYEDRKKKLVERLEAMPQLGTDRVIKLTDFAEADAADIEDMFEPGFYLELVNAAYRRELGRTITISDLKQAGLRIVPRLEHYFDAEQIANGKFGHAFVAEHFARNVLEYEGINDATLNRFEALFERVNALLPQPKKNGGKSMASKEVVATDIAQAPRSSRRRA